VSAFAADRQPVHTVYGGADLWSRDLAGKLGAAALRSLERHAPDPPALATVLEWDDGELAERIYGRVVAKLESEPVEDFRIDFEDGFGTRPDDEEDAAARAAAREVAAGLEAGTLPPFLGIRIKSLAGGAAPRARRTLELFVTELVDASGGAVPPGFVVTNPKVSEPAHAAELSDLLDELEARTGLAPGTIATEVMIETPRSVIGAEGRFAPARLVDAGRGRCVAAHFGVYDYTASLEIAARHQTIDHPACDFARDVLQVALAGTGVWISDGATNVLPAGDDRATVHRAWRLHYDHVRRSLRRAYWQGWDLHPAQLPTRYAAVYAFFAEGLPQATDRLRRFVERAARATLSGDVFDDAATGQGLLNFFLRGWGCGAVTDEEVAATGLTPEELRTRSFARIVEERGG